MARHEMDPQQAYFYWMPLLLDVETRAQFLRHRGGAASIKTLKEGASGAPQELLKEAEDYLQRACTADPAYLPAKINLAVAYLYLGRPNRARSVLTDAREIAPDDVNVEILDALALYEQTETGLDLWPAAVSRLEKLVAKPNARENALFNMARLLEVRSRPAEAQEHWNHLAFLADKLPDPIRSVVCREQTKNPTESCGQVIPAGPSVPGEWPLDQDSASRVSKHLRQAQLGDWKVIGFDWFKGNLHGHIYQRPDGQAEVLELDGFVQMQVLKGGPLGPMTSLREHCSRPLHERRLVHGALLSCGKWAALAEEGELKELWSIK
jgi:tetratricopeptide (TPR) repeat protein